MQTFAQQPAILTLAYFAYHCLPSPTIAYSAYPAYLAYYCLPRLPCLLLPTIAYPAYLAYYCLPCLPCLLLPTPPTMPTMKRGQPSRNCPHFSYKECKR